MVTPKDAWSRQKNSAIKRGVGWDFTFEQWCAWWKCRLGTDWFSKRGRRKGQYVMARDGDTGPYEPWNVRCATVEENHVEFNGYKPVSGKPYKARIRKETVIAVFKAKGRYEDVAKQHGIEPFRVHCIKTRKYYRSVTDNL